MDSFLTTYRKDYRWPIQKSLPLKSDGLSPDRKVTGCCTEPLMPCFKKPVTQEMQLSAVPQSEGVKEKQPDAFLNQLYKDNPYLYGFKKAPQSDEKNMKLLSQRFISTYQHDYGGQQGAGEQSSEKKNPCCCKYGDGDESKFTANQPIPVPHLRVPISNRSSGRSSEKQTPGQTTQKPGVSEYMDSISKTGSAILRRKLLL